MKKTRRFAAMLAAMALASTMVAPTMMNASAENVNIKVQTDGKAENEVTTITPDKDNATHTYTAYQIFKGNAVQTAGVDTTDNTNDDEYEFKITGLGENAGTLLTNAAFLAFRPSDADISVGEALAKLPNGASNDEKAIAAAQAISGITNGSAKADELAEILSKVVSGGTAVTTEANAFAEGYYLVTDSYTPAADATANNKPDAVSKFILRVNSAENKDGITIIPKKSYPEVIKKVKEDDKTTDAYDPAPADGSLKAAVNNADKWNDVADYCIGEDVPFQLYGSMPETLADYDAYYYKFTDTLGTQFDKPNTVTVKVGTKTLTFTLDAAKTAYELPAEDQLQAAAATSITTYTFKNAATQSKIYAALKDVTEYTSLSAAAKAEYIHDNWSTLTGNDGALKDLGFTAEADAITATTTNISAVNADSSTDGNCRVKWAEGNKLEVSFEDVKAYAGVTKDTIVTVEYEAKLNANANIGLNGQENKVDLTYSNNPNVDYAPKKDNTEDIPGTNEKDTTPEDKVVVFTYEVDINKIDADTKQKLEGAEFELKSGSTAIKFVDNGNGTYTVADQTLTTGVTTTIKSDANGLFKLIGLDNGTYTLTETKAPEGYPTPASPNFTLVLTATTANNQAWNGTASAALESIAGTLNGTNMTVLNTGTVNGNTRGENGGVEGTIQNSKSTSLPSTGGMGTKLFIAGGGITATLAAVYLVSKKRSRKEE